MWKYFLLLFALANYSNAVLQTDADTLVLLDNLAIRETHSMFFKSLQGKSMGFLPFFSDVVIISLQKYFYEKKSGLHIYITYTKRRVYQHL